MKYWVSHLPTEVWMDVFCFPWISRKELAEIVDRFRNRKFAEYLQFYLHDWGKRKLSRMYFDRAAKGILKYVRWPESRYQTEIPLTPIPYNIKSFECIAIGHFDAQTYAFLRQIGPILTDVHLQLSNISPTNMENLSVILANLVPLLNGTLSLSCDASVLPTVQQCFGIEKLAHIKVLEIHGYGYGKEEQQQAMTVNFLLNWLFSPGQDDSDGQRFCKATLSNALFEEITPAICQKFLAAQTPSTFGLILQLYSASSQFAGVKFHLQNNIGEELHGAVTEHGDFQTQIQITRHRTNCGKELEEWIKKKKNNYHPNNTILIQSPTVGLLDGMDAPENEDKDPQPSTSKKARNNFVCPMDKKQARKPSTSKKDPCLLM